MTLQTPLFVGVNHRAPLSVGGVVASKQSRPGARCSARHELREEGSLEEATSSETTAVEVGSSSRYGRGRREEPKTIKAVVRRGCAFR
jgi:hypothetical protein